MIIAYQNEDSRFEKVAEDSQSRVAGGSRTRDCLPVYHCGPVLLPTRVESLYCNPSTSQFTLPSYLSHAPSPPSYEYLQRADTRRMLTGLSIDTTLDSPVSTPLPESRNYIYLKTRTDPIKGLFHIDPSISVFGVNSAGETSQRWMQKNMHRHRLYKRGAFKRPSNNVEPNAIFASKCGDIDIDLSISGPRLANQLETRKTLIQVASKSGDIEARVRHVDKSVRLNFEAYSQRGSIIVHLPRTFSGYIYTYNGSGRTMYLHSLARSAKVISNIEHESQVALGNVRYSSLPAGVEWEGDTVHVASRDGNIFIGYFDEDMAPPPPMPPRLSPTSPTTSMIWRNSKLMKKKSQATLVNLV
ncbi:hypothetical protein M422DRAFT_41644 [Sphaerobolus stellatus SS14]|nr:hypothetical protein M422DRAFT_41644 [Sphaerobolus stellatus SS14]